MFFEINQDEVQFNVFVVLVMVEICYLIMDLFIELVNWEFKYLFINDLLIECQVQDVSWGMMVFGGVFILVVDCFVCYVNCDNIIVVLLKNQVIVVEIIVYCSFEVFIDVVMWVVDVCVQVLLIVGLECIGFCFVLEICVFVGVDGWIMWSNWIDEQLFGLQCFIFGGLVLIEWQGVVVYCEL